MSLLATGILSSHPTDFIGVFFNMRVLMGSIAVVISQLLNSIL